MPTVNWGTSTLNFAGVQRVYTRQRWADGWNLSPHFWCEDVSWSLLPTMPTARLIRYYGRGLAQGAANTSVIPKLDVRGYYVRIEIDCDDGTLSWYGFIDEQIDEQGGVSDVPTGKQSFVCYSMAQLLAHEYMTASTWYDEPNTELRTTGSSIAFNQRGYPNRTKDVPSGAGATSHVFYPRLPENKYQDPHPWERARYWPSIDIIDYLQNYAKPLDASGNALIPIRWDNLHLVPEWDAPTIQTEGRTVLSIVNQVINAGRLLQVSTGVDGTTSPETVVFKVHSASDTAISLHDSNTHPANTDILHVVTTAAQDAGVSVRSSTTRLAHQVVVKGARRETCLSTGIGSETFKAAFAFAPGWTDAQETEYEAGASGESDYSSLSVSSQRRANAIARGKEELDGVHKTFVLHSDWNREVDATPGSLQWVFQQANPDYDAAATPPDPTAEQFIEYHPWWGELRVSKQLPFKEGYDYTGAAPVDADDDVKAQYRAPYVLFLHEDDNKWLQAEKMSNGLDPRFSVGVGIAKEGLGINLDVHGEFQHAIAVDQFTPLPADDDLLGDWDYISGCGMTVSLQEDRYAEARFPADTALSASRDVIRRRVIYAGASYRQVRVLDGTTVNIDTDGSKKLTVAALTDAEQYIVNDSERLQSLAELAAQWYTVDRKVAVLNAARPSAVPAVGQILKTANGETINNLVTQIAVSLRQGNSASPPGASYQLQTAMGEVDVLQFSPPITKANRVKPPAPVSV